MADQFQIVISGSAHVRNLSSIIAVEHLQVVMLYHLITDENYKSFTAIEQGASRHKYKLPMIITMYIYLSDSCLNIMSCTIYVLCTLQVSDLLLGLW